jgi:hypothetical protein
MYTCHEMLMRNDTSGPTGNASRMPARSIKRL